MEIQQVKERKQTAREFRFSGDVATRQGGALCILNERGSAESSLDHHFGFSGCLGEGGRDFRFSSSVASMEGF